MSVILDRLTLKYEKVTEEQIERLLGKMSAQQMLIPGTPVIVRNGISIKEYHLNVHVGKGEGAVFIGWKHNTAKEKAFHDLKVEFNPSKFADSSFHDDEQKKIYDVVFKNINTVLHKNRRLIVSMDLAFDVQRSMKEIIVVSKSGKTLNRHKGTLYFGVRGKDGYLKVYDKKKERLQVFKKKFREKYKNILIDDLESVSKDAYLEYIRDSQEVLNLEVSEEMTRIEYTFKEPNGILINSLSKAPRFNLNDLYGISLFNLEKLSGEEKSCLICYHRGDVELKEFKRTMKNKIKEAIQNMGDLDLDSILKASWHEIIDIITNYIRV